jgi:hypothetical protein
VIPTRVWKCQHKDHIHDNACSENNSNCNSCNKMCLNSMSSARYWMWQLWTLQSSRIPQRHVAYRHLVASKQAVTFSQLQFVFLFCLLFEPEGSYYTFFQNVEFSLNSKALQSITSSCLIHRYLQFAWTRLSYMAHRYKNLHQGNISVRALIAWRSVSSMKLWPYRQMQKTAHFLLYEVQAYWNAHLEQKEYYFLWTASVV